MLDVETSGESIYLHHFFRRGPSARPHAILDPALASATTCPGLPGEGDGRAAAASRGGEASRGSTCCGGRASVRAGDVGGPRRGFHRCSAHDTTDADQWDLPFYIIGCHRGFLFP